MPEPTAAYVHVPFCAHHCAYCDFAVAAGRDDAIDLYVEALAAELATLGSPRRVSTLFVGGGTPTHLNNAQLGRLFDALDRWLPRDGGAEVTVEANPDDLDDDKVVLLADRGVNRVSVGVQSFDGRALAALDRRHTAAQVPAAIERVRRRIGRLSLDLIFAAPGQSVADWDADLRRALAFDPGHVSTYGLTYEKGTPLWKAARRGAVTPVPEDDELAMYERAMDVLGAAGYRHYEISNFARPGHESRHNQVYWANDPYFGFGVGAARYVDGARELNTRSLHEYIKRALAGEPAAFQSERLAPEARARETVAVQLRRAEGIDRAEFRARTGYGLDALCGGRLAVHAGAGLLADDGTRVSLTRRGKCVADGLIAELVYR